MTPDRQRQIDDPSDAAQEREPGIPALAAGSLLGPYRLEAPIIGTAGMGEMWKARDQRSGRDVGICVYARSFTGGFDREARAIASLGHANIGAPIDAGPNYVVTELIEGMTLSGRIAQGPIPLEEALGIAAQIADALAALHEKGIVHRDLQPANIMVTPAGLVKVMNFRLGAEAGAASPGTDHVTATPDSPTIVPIEDASTYAGPQEFNGEPADQRSDVRALGDILAQMSSGSDAGLPSAVRDVLARSRADSPAVRLPTAAEMAVLLKNAAHPKKPLSGTNEQGAAIAVRSFLPLDDGVTGSPQPARPESHLDASRYVDIGLLGAGGMGEVRRVRDRALNRIIAMKIIKPEAAWLGTRFVQEARITAQLEHPAIVPVHEIGTLSDGRFYFTMKEVQGQTLSAVIREAHAQWRSPEATRAGETKWTLRQLIVILQRASEGVGYAHDHGVLHRDLKPSNIMIGASGEVLVLDWGLTRAGETPATDLATAETGEGASIGDSTRSGEERTRIGMVMGTARFMSPEQATGDVGRITVRSDVFSLGCVLYNLLAGSPPYEDPILSPLDALLKGRLKEFGARAGGEQGPLIPAELRDICRRAMAFAPEDRFASGGEFASAVASWLDGAQRREQAMRVLDRARELKLQAQALIAEGGELEAQASGILALIPPFAPAETKRDAWAMQDRAARLRGQAEALDARFINTVHVALSLSDDLAPAHQMLAEHYRERHAIAEAARDEAAVVRFETLLGVHDDGRYAVYLKGDGALTLVTDPPGAKADLYRYEQVERRMVAQFVGELGYTPIDGHALPMGSYLVKLSHPERAVVDYPVSIDRELHWDGIRPGGTSPHPIYLPLAHELGNGDRYVPAGWFSSGGDARARNGLPGRRLWLDGFVTPRDPVTVGEYLVFLNDLAANGKYEEAAAALPEVPEWESKEEASDREFGFSRTPDGRFVFDGGEERFNLPIAWVSWYQAKAYSAWMAAREHMPWRLLQEMEHEKASRGVDGRYFPWGNHFDATFCAMRDSHPGAGRVMRFTVAEFPIDESPYGVRGCAGNTFAWCEDAYSPTGPEIRDGIPFPPDPANLMGPGAGGAHRIMRGGSYRDSEAYCRTSFRDCPPAICHYDQIGFRVARSLP